MTTQRALGVEDKEERKQELLDAVEKLYLKHPDRMPNVSEVADQAGLAKGTVYLYFPTKEDMLPGATSARGPLLHGADEALAQPGPLTFDDVFAVTLSHLIRTPGYLALSSHCFAQMERETPFESAVAFKIGVAQTLKTAGAGLERHFPTLGDGDGVRILLHSYGLICGLWQLLHPNERFEKAMRRPELAILKRDYEKEIETALRALWTGLLRLPRTTPMKTPTLALLCAAALVLAACGTAKTETDPVRPVVMGATRDTSAPLPHAMSIPANFARALQRPISDSGSAERSWPRLVDAGARVTKGQVLASLDPDDAKLAAQGATAQLASAEADFALAKAELARHQDLLAKKFISQSAFRREARTRSSPRRRRSSRSARKPPSA